MTKPLSENKWVFMGTATHCSRLLQHLKTQHGISPDLIVTNPDRPTGRKQILTASPVKEYAVSHGITYIQPANLDTCLEELTGYDFFCVSPMDHFSNSIILI